MTHALSVIVMVLYRIFLRQCTASNYEGDKDCVYEGERNTQRDREKEKLKNQRRKMEESEGLLSSWTSLSPECRPCRRLRGRETEERKSMWKGLHLRSCAAQHQEEEEEWDVQLR